MVIVDGYIGHDPEFRVAARLYVEAANANIAGHAAAALLPARGRRGVRARALRHLHAEPEGGGVPGRPAHHRRPRGGPHARLQLGLLRRVEEGRAADVEQARLRPRRAPAPRRLQDHPHRRGRQGRAHRRALRHRQDDDDVHTAERLAAGPGRLRRVAAERPHRRHRERLLREDVRAEPGGRADDPRRGDAAGVVPRERLADTATRSTSTTPRTRRTGARRSRSA